MGVPLLKNCTNSNQLIAGDEIPKEDVWKLLEELAPKEDDEGFIPYAPFLEKLCAKPV